MVGYDRKCISSRCVAKINLRKAYDSVHWGFINELLMKLRFSELFVRWVMVYISSASYSINVIEGGEDTLKVVVGFGRVNFTLYFRDCEGGKDTLKVVVGFDRVNFTLYFRDCDGIPHS
ncbi:hypothetical protein Dimus_038372 [Dionaea muscipula]